VAEAALSASARRRRRRRRSGGGADGAEGGADDDPPNTVVHVRDGRQTRASGADEDGVRGVKGSTRLEAKRQRRRDNRDSGRRRAPILTEAEFLARREAVDRVMAVRQNGDRTQIAVLEDDILVEHYVTRASAASAVGNVYLGRVQNVLPSMEAAFVDIGRGRNGVLYAGEVNWEAAGLEGKARSIESALNPGDSVLVQVTKDPIGHKGARLTSQVSLPGRFVVYVPGGGMTGISRKLPDVERTRLKAILKKVVPDDAGVIVRTAAEGASEVDLISDVERLKAQWQAIAEKAAKSSNAPTLVYGEPDLAIRVVRDVFNDDFSKLIVAGSGIYETVAQYVSDVAPDLADKIALHSGDRDLFRDLRVDEQLAKALDRKVWLPSGGSLVIDRTEAMTVVDVNTGKYTGSGGNLEQTVTRNNLEAAEEIVRQLRLRDIGGIIVIDFIDMVIESNRELVLRRTKHQVAEVTSLGLVQMTRKRVGEGLLEAFSEPCEHCKGRGVIVHTEPVDKRFGGDQTEVAAEDDRPARRNRKTKTSTQLDAQAQALADEQRRMAADAIAVIAKATNHQDQDAEDAIALPEAVETVVEPVTVVTARPRRRRAASRPAGPPAGVSAEPAVAKG
jgi:ribonuclease E